MTGHAKAQPGANLPYTLPIMANTCEGLPDGALATLRTAWPNLPWSQMRPTHGAFHVVLVLPPTAVIRVRSGTGHAGYTARELYTAQILTAAGLNTPPAIGEPLVRDGWSAAAFGHAPGAALTASTWVKDRRVVLPLLDTWAEAGRASAILHRDLPPTRTWCGGERWPELVTRITAGAHHVPDLERAATRCVREVLAAEQDAPSGAVHGDFGPHNILIDDEGGVRVIDADHAAWADPAIDVAPLLAHYDPAELALDLDDEVLRRAAIHRRSLSLQVAAAAELAGDDSLRDHALGNFTRRQLGR